jgi:hypothetical protein
MKYILNTELQNLSATYITKEDYVSLSQVLGISIPKLRNILKGQAHCTGPQIDTIQSFVVMRHKLAANKINSIPQNTEPCL